MKVTFGMLNYLLSETKQVEQLCAAADTMPLLSVAEFRGGRAQPNILYYKTTENGLLAFSVTRECELPKYLADTDAAGEKNMSAVFLHGIRGPECLYQAFQAFYTTQDAMTTALLSHAEVAGILAPAHALLRIPYMLVSRDMRILYCHPTYFQIPKIIQQGEAQYVEDMLQELMLSKRFHEVAKLREPFYYQTGTAVKNSYCHNILLGGDYFARLVLALPDVLDRLPNGAEQLAAWLADFCTMLAENGLLHLGRHANDALHSLLRNISPGTVIEPAVYEEALANYGWRLTQEYRFLIVRVFDASGWDSQMEAPLAVIRSDLEETWPDSCAAITGQEIHWLIHSAAAESQKEKGFFRQLALYVRENVCRVGCSGIFKDIALLPSAIAQAEAALALGEQRNPSHWFYRFDDYRLAFMEEAIRAKGLPAQMLIHPAVQTLMDYDAGHESELAQTLRVYLDCHCNATDAADALFVHRTTLFRRLERIREIGGIDPNDSAQTLLLMLSYRLLP